MGDKHPYSELRDKIVYGVNLAFRRMVEKARINDEDLVFSENGVPYKVKARDYKFKEEEESKK